MKSSSWFVLTGGPSSGKTTLLHELKGRGYTTVSESSRQYIENQLAKNLTIEKIRGDEKKFQEEVLKQMAELHQKLDKNKLIFFDRGYHDAVAYLNFYNYKIEEFVKDIAQQASYAKVFVLEMLPYIKDEARIESQEIAKGLQQALITAYREAGHEIVNVPVMSVEERADFVISHVDM